jgi:hypothetical protein
MLSTAKRRIVVLERSIHIPMTGERFFDSVQERVRLTGASFHDATQSLFPSWSAGFRLEHFEPE